MLPESGECICNSLAGVTPPIPRLSPSKIKFDSPTKLVPLPPVITRLLALLDIVADPAAP